MNSFPKPPCLVSDWCRRRALVSHWCGHRPPKSAPIRPQVTAHANGDLGFFIKFHIYCQEFKQVRGGEGRTWMVIL